MPPTATSRSTAFDSRDSVSKTEADPWQGTEPEAAPPSQAAKPPVSSSFVKQSSPVPSTPAPSQPKRSPLRDSPALPLILMAWFTVVVLRAAIELSIELGVGIVALIRWSIRRYQAQQALSQSSGNDAAVPEIEQLATAG